MSRSQASQTVRTGRKPRCMCLAYQGARGWKRAQPVSVWPTLRRARLRPVAHGFQLEAVRIEPVRGVAMLSVLRERLRLVEDDGVTRTRPPMRGADDVSRRDEERKMMEPGPA